MIFIKNKITDVYFNLAMEEYIFEKFKEDEVFMLWINEPSVVIGKHQNLIEELKRSAFLSTCRDCCPARAVTAQLLTT